jgi:hypothetical protein
MQAATVMAVMGDSEGSSVGHGVRSEVVVSRVNDGKITLDTKSTVSTVTLDVTNMVVVVCHVITVLLSNLQLKDEKKKEGKEERKRKVI